MAKLLGYLQRQTMSDFSVRSDAVDVEQIMRQIRSRIREKRGVDYTEDEIRELANVKLETFIDPKGVRSGLLDEYRRVSAPEADPPNYAFGEDTLFETHRGPIRWIRSLLRPFLKLLFNPNPLIQALHIQADLNQRNAERWAKREHLDALHYEVIHNLVVEVTRNTLEVKGVKMRLESMASRLDFDERRARALEGVVQYRPGAVAPLQPPTGQDRSQDRGREQRRDQRPQGQGSPSQMAQPGAPPPAAGALDNDGNERRARRRRRRGRRRGGEGRGPMGEDRGLAADGRGVMAGGPGPMTEGAGADAEAASGALSESHADDRVSNAASRDPRTAPRVSDSEGGSGGASDATSPPDPAES
jgi:hypothetical protein